MHKSRIIPSGLAVFAVAFLLLVYQAFLWSVDESGCDKVWMYPSYAKLTTLTTEHSRMASKYSIHLYREGHIDKDYDNDLSLHGVPVLFIPGHAGSYRQARSLASYSAREHHRDSSLQKFDFFTADFTEDFTAFHGQTMLDQAEFVNDAIKFILSLYNGEQSEVLVVGHSMGGIVARSLVALPNYVANSINTIVTLSTPHTTPPLTFDHDIITVYDLVNQYWRHAFAKPLEQNPLNDMVLISIAGGRRDAMVPSDYCTTLSVVPESHGFTTFTSTIPNCWTSVDHLAMAWCGQMRGAVADAMLSIYQHGQTIPLADRMQVFRKKLLSGFEKALDRELEEGKVEKLDFEPVSDIAVEQLTRTVGLRLNTTIVVYSSTNDVVYKCGDTCIIQEPLRLPLSRTEFPYQQKTLNFYRIEPEHGFTHVVAKPGNEPGFFAASPNHGQLTPSTMTEITVHSATTSLMAYKLHVKSQHKSKFFEPIVRQYVNEPHEAQFHVNMHDKTVPLIFHGASPYVPYLEGQNDKLRLQVFTPPDCGNVQVDVRVDLLGVLGNLALKYRIMAATMPLAVALIVFSLQIYSYSYHGAFITFYEGLTALANRILPVASGLVALHLILGFQTARDILRAVQIPSESRNVRAMEAFNKHLKQNDLYMGTSDARFCFLAPVLFMVAIGLCVVVNAIVQLIAHIKVPVTIQTHRSPYRVSRRLVLVVVMAVLVGTVVPFQFAFVLVAIMQLVNTTLSTNQFHQVLSNDRSDSATRRHRGNFANLNASLAVVFILTSIVNAPIIVVWVHNYIENRPLKFASHHNILAILPVLLVVENLMAGNMVPRLQNTLQRVITMGYCGYMVAYCVLYGTQHTYMLHYLVNILCTWLLVVYMDDPGTRGRMKGVLANRKSV